ncbi:MAG: PEP-CTERM sorting domain-containing protein [Planctomycetota bacterium]|nr:MAG: PEP-CTERM sorting domain-containing protein [Planctomycetota bacterium]
MRHQPRKQDPVQSEEVWKMRKVIATLAIVGLGAGFAMADPIDRSNTPIFSDGNGVTFSAEPMDGPGIGLSGGNNIYDSNAAGSAGFFAFPAATGAIGIDDYGTINGPGGTSVIDEFGFVGGVTSAGQVMFFTFFTSGGSFATSFGVQFPQGGNFIWTITFTTPRTIPNDGLLQAFADTGFVVPSTGQWFFTSSDAVVVGSNNTTFGPPPITTTFGGQVATVQNFRLDAVIPEPATLGLLGLGVTCLIARRRR